MLVAGCVGSQSPVGAPGEMAQRSPIATHADHGTTWMLPEAKSEDLLYISDTEANDVYVYRYPQARLVGTLTGFNEPRGLCVDRAGDVFITNDDATARTHPGPRLIIEYAHGGTQPIAILGDPGHDPFGCAVDSTTGNVAVTNYRYDGNKEGDIAIYDKAKGTWTALFDETDLYNPYFCGYNDKGDLFVDGVNNDGAFNLVEIGKGYSLLNISIAGGTIYAPGSVEWDDPYVAVGDQEFGGNAGTSGIYQIAVSGSGGTIEGATSLTGANDVVQFWIQGSTVVAPDAGNDDVGFYSYPAGGSPIKTLTGFDKPFGSAVSKAKSLRSFPPHAPRLHEHA